jgi:hypothetical protein
MPEEVFIVACTVRGAEGVAVWVGDLLEVRKSSVCPSLWNSQSQAESRQDGRE